MTKPPCAGFCGTNGLIHPALLQSVLLDQARDAILIRALDHRILYWNRSAERLFGWSAAEAIDRSSLALLDPPDGPRCLEAHQAVLAHGEWNGELAHLAKNGTTVPVESRWTLVRDHQGQPQSILVINRDLTESKRIEAHHLRAQRLESIGALASGIAHDLNNVLAPILMSIELLGETLTDERNVKLLETLRGSALRGGQMVRQILTFTRGEQSQRVITTVQPLVAEVVRIIRETFPKNLQIQVETAPDLPPVFANPTQFQQVLMNLCVNARDAMPAGGTLALRAARLTLDLFAAQKHPDARPGTYLTIAVADTGTGIPPEALGKIWEPFFTLKAVGEGTGLGLATVRQIVRAHGGFITVASEPGCGSCFQVHLPASALPVKASVPPALQPLPGHGEKILIVDDEPAFLEITEAIFNRYGYRVVTAHDGQEALAVFAKQRNEVDLVMTDMVMPVLDGKDTIRGLQRISPQVPIIAASGLNENESVTQDFENTSFLLKPFTTEKLLATVNERLHGKVLSN